MRGGFPFAVLAALVAGRLPAAPVLLQEQGVYQDCLGDATGLSVRQNVAVGPALTPGVRVSLSDWSWAQSFTPASDAVSSPFSDPKALHNLTQVPPLCSTCGAWEEVTLWQRTFRAATDLTLAPTVATTNYDPTSTVPGPFRAYRGNVEQLRGSKFISGPFETDLGLGRDYTATFRSFFCDDPTCKSPWAADGVDLGTFIVAYGALQAAVYPAKVGVPPTGDFALGEGAGSLSPLTLEWQVPSPLPPGNGWEYQLQITMSTSGAPSFPACAPVCSASLWFDSVTVMAKGRRIPVGPFVTSCGPMDKPCGGSCIPKTAPCGQDGVTYFVDTGSYVSPVFDSLSEKTVWQSIWWHVIQNYTADDSTSQGWPRSPITIKWRVGDSLDPSVWLAKPEWYTWTVENTVTCSGEAINCNSNCSGGHCDCTPGQQRNEFIFPCDPTANLPIPYRVPMPNVGQSVIYADGVAKAVGRYFQYEVDFSSWYANDRFPPEAAGLGRELHDPVDFGPSSTRIGPVLKAIRAFYTPARGLVVSGVIRPSLLRRWGSVVYQTDVASGGTVIVDVLDEKGVPLFTNVPSGFSLEGLDPDRYPALRLRAAVDNDGVPTQRPVLKCWELRWSTFAEALRINRNSISLARGEVVSIWVTVPVARPGNFTVHDVAGQLVAQYHVPGQPISDRSGVFPAGTLIGTWDGRNGHGDKVAPGVYFLSLEIKHRRYVEKIAVVP